MIQFDQLTGSHGYIGHATLDNPKALNALNHNMADALNEQLEQWQSDPQCQAILLTGAGERAFCAGGDVKYVTVTGEDETDRQRFERSEAYFASEYKADQLLHRSNKPVIVWAHGVVMGGGMGLMQGADFRIVTPSSRIAMPETAIGLYPDVGANYFLNRVPFGLGELLGISGVHLNGADALFLNLADLQIPDDFQDALKKHLTQIEWIGDFEGNKGQIGHLLLSLSPAIQALEDSPAFQNLQTLIGLRDAPSLYHRFEGLKNLKFHHNDWLQRMGQTAAKGSPLSVALTHRYLHEHRHSSLSECFAADLKLSSAMVQHPEFKEGVRAVLIDKDQNPQWQFKDVRDVPTALLDQLMDGP